MGKILCGHFKDILIDDKGRFVIPKQLRGDEKEYFVVEDLDELNLYPKPLYEKLIGVHRKKNRKDSERRLFAKANQKSLDKQGRINVHYAGWNGRVNIQGNLDHIVVTHAEESS